MKKLITLFVAALLFAACNNPEAKVEPKINDVAYFDWSGADYWVLEYDSTATKEDLKEYLKSHTHGTKTSWVFFYPNNEDNSLYKTEKFNEADFKATIVKNKPPFAFYRMMPADTTIHEDALDYLNAELANK